MSRRGNGEGTITRRKDGRWEARYYVQTVSGAKRKVLYGKTRAEARDKLAKALSDRIDGIVYDDENMTLGEYLEVWLKGSVFGSVRQSTYDRDTNLVNNHIKPVLGGLKLKKLNPAQVQSFYRDRLDAGLSGSTVQRCTRHLAPWSRAGCEVAPRPRKRGRGGKATETGSQGDASPLHRRGSQAASSSLRRPSRSVVRPRYPYRHETGRTAGTQVARR